MVTIFGWGQLSRCPRLAVKSFGAVALRGDALTRVLIQFFEGDAPVDARVARLPNDVVAARNLTNNFIPSQEVGRVGGCRISRGHVLLFYSVWLGFVASFLVGNSVNSVHRSGKRIETVARYESNSLQSSACRLQ